MLAVSVEARNFLASIRKPDGDQVLRLVEAGNLNGSHGVSLEVGEPRGDDQVIEHEGEILLCISRSVSEALDGCVLRREKTSESVRLVVAPPEALECSR